MKNTLYLQSRLATSLKHLFSFTPYFSAQVTALQSRLKIRGAQVGKSCREEKK